MSTLVITFVDSFLSAALFPLQVGSRLGRPSPRQSSSQPGVQNPGSQLQEHSRWRKALTAAAGV